MYEATGSGGRRWVTYLQGVVAEPAAEAERAKQADVSRPAAPR